MDRSVAVPEVTTIVATYGDRSVWEPYAARALASIQAQTLKPAEVIRVHGTSLQQARNEALASVKSEWLVYVDADDEIHPEYLHLLAEGSADLRVPSICYQLGDTVGEPKMPRVAGHSHDCTPDCLIYGNWIIIGAMVRTELVRRVGGWRDFEWSEDWDLWLRCYLAKASIEAIPEAIYKAHIRPASRNRALDRQNRIAVHRQIAQANGVPVP